MCPISRNNCSPSCPSYKEAQLKITNMPKCRKMSLGCFKRDIMFKTTNFSSFSAKILTLNKPRTWPVISTQHHRATKIEETYYCLNHVFIEVSPFRGVYIPICREKIEVGKTDEQVANDWKAHKK